MNGADATDEAIAALVTRRRSIRSWWKGDQPWNDADDPRIPIGIAFSGGGIRSATFALGVLQGLAKSPRDALSRIDILSTVSGGGYIGTFFRSLFMPTSLRDIRCLEAPQDGAADREIADQYRLARTALASSPNLREVAWQPAGAATATRLRNPLWWLREHSRYLAPSGPTDYFFAVAYFARNWLAMIYLFVLACVALAVPTVMIEAAAMAWARRYPAALPGWMGWPAADAIAISPIALLAVLPIVALAGLSIAYWATQAMSTNEPELDRQQQGLTIAVRAIVLGAALAVILALVVRASTVQDGHATVLNGAIGVIFVLGIVASLLGAAIAYFAGKELSNRGSMLTSALRLWLTKWLATSGRWLLLIVAVAIVDSFGAWLSQPVTLLSFGHKVWTAALFPIFAFLIKKLPDWFGGTGGGSGMIGGLLKRFASTIALLVGVGLYGMLAVGALTLVHNLGWWGAPWISAPRWPGLILLAGIAWILAVVSGDANGFINLSSLHPLYSSRLIRAYLGASNVERLRLTDQGHPKPITENHPRDYIQPRVYGETDLPAPMHIINVTLNETIDPSSQIVARDRKGDLLSLEPGGIRIGSDLVDWSRLTNTPPVDNQSHAEGISLGQWCAISGAAASSAMGRMSNLGYAIAFTFANIRLGYWWWAPKVCPDMPPAKGFAAAFAKNFGTFVYLANEMTCRYSRGYDRKYLTDGGHYENSGAFTLIRRRVPLILVSDAGADPDYVFEDMQSLIRQVRIDLGGETTILGGRDLRTFAAALGARTTGIFVDPQARPDWKAAMLDPGKPAFVLVLRVELGGEPPVHLLWVKPRVLPDLPADVAGYAALTKTFPQQGTGNQFFDEAQWESYRRLGEESVGRLLAACPGLLSDSAAPST